jgi:hypothetical protein
MAHTPTPWFAADWSHDFGTNFTTVEARSKEILRPGQSSIWPDGIAKRRVAETTDGDNPIEDAAFIVKACNAYDVYRSLLDEARIYMTHTGNPNGLAERIAAALKQQ